MKTKCQCGKPDFPAFPHQLETPSGTIRMGERDYFAYPVGNDLHFKPADRICERCGVGLCGDCSKLIAVWKNGPGKVVHYCQSCKELGI